MMAPVANGDRRCRHRHQQLLANIGACIAWLDEFRRFLLVADWSDETRAMTQHTIYGIEEDLLRFARRYKFALGPVRPGAEVDRS